MPSFQIIGSLVLKKIFKGLNLNRQYKLSFPLPKDASHEIWIETIEIGDNLENFETCGHIHLYSLGQGQTTPWGQMFSLTHLFSQ